MAMIPVKNVWILSKVNLISLGLCIIPFFTWSYLYKSYLKLKEDYNEEDLFHLRHNCVIMYFKDKGFSGWPPCYKRINLDCSNISILYDPFLYFINTAEYSLDIAMMVINVRTIIDALIDAHKRGVKIRVLVNFDQNPNHFYKLLGKQGVPVVCYISKVNTSSIMHNKYIIKDYKNGNGFLLIGSCNMTYNAFINNYEDVVMTSNPTVVAATNKNFNECWDYINSDNENLYNKIVLKNAKWN